MIQGQKIDGGTLYDQGLNEFGNDQLTLEQGKHQIAKQGHLTVAQLPYQGLPIVLNDDDGLDAVKQQLVSSDLGGSLFIPDNVNDTQIVWVLFKSMIGPLLNDALAYQEWMQFVFENDHVLPVNLQVQNRDADNQVLLPYQYGVDNVNAEILRQLLIKQFDGDVKVLQSGQKLIQVAMIDGTYNAPDKTHYLQTNTKVTHHYRDSNGQLKTYVTTLGDGNPDLKFPDITNVIDFYTYNGRVECFLMDSSQLGVVFNQLSQVYFQGFFFNDDQVDQYISRLNDDLNDDNDQSDDVSRYVNQSSSKAQLEQQYQQSDEVVHPVSWLKWVGLNLWMPTVGRYQKWLNPTLFVLGWLSFIVMDLLMVLMMPTWLHQFDGLANQIPHMDGWTSFWTSLWLLFFNLFSYWWFVIGFGFGLLYFSIRNVLPMRNILDRNWNRLNHLSQQLLGALGFEWLVWCNVVNVSWLFLIHDINTLRVAFLLFSIVQVLSFVWVVVIAKRLNPFVNRATVFNNIFNVIGSISLPMAFVMMGVINYVLF